MAETFGRNGSDDRTQMQEITPTFALLSSLSRSRKPLTNGQTFCAPRAASVETLEDRRLYSVSTGGEVSSFSWGMNQTGTYGVQLPAVQKTNIIGVLIAL